MANRYFILKELPQDDSRLYLMLACMPRPLKLDGVLMSARPIAFVHFYKDPLAAKLNDGLPAKIGPGMTTKLIGKNERTFWASPVDCQISVTGHVVQTDNERIDVVVPTSELFAAAWEMQLFAKSGIVGSKGNFFFRSVHEIVTQLRQGQSTDEIIAKAAHTILLQPILDCNKMCLDSQDTSLLVIVRLDGVDENGAHYSVEKNK